MTKLSDFQTDDKNLRKIFKNKISSSKLKKYTEITCIFNICIKDKSLFTNIKGTINNESEYIDKWIAKYINAKDNNVFAKIGNPSSTLPDPIVDTIIASRLGLEEETTSMRDAHRLYMYAEQIQGSILEAFLARTLYPYKWYYCYGEVVKSVDFCHENGYLLQIKNKYNTENSSSSKVREGTEIKKWYRLARPINNKVTYNWDELCNLVNSFKEDNMENLNIGEEDYKEFVLEVIKENPKLFYVDNKNYWVNDRETTNDIKLKHLQEYLEEGSDLFANMDVLKEDEEKEFLNLISSDYIHIPELKINIHEYLYCSDYNEDIEDYESMEPSYYIFDSETYDELAWSNDIINCIFCWKRMEYTEDEIKNLPCKVVKGNNISKIKIGLKTYV